MKAVFVYDDGQVGLRDLPPSCGQNDSYREAVKEPMSVKWGQDSTDLLSRPRYVEWFRRSQMYDGRPVFVAPRFAIKEAGASMFVTRRDIESDAAGVKQSLRDNVRAFIRRNAPQAILLDEDVRKGLPVEPGMEQQQIEHWGLRGLFAVPDDPR